MKLNRIQTSVIALAVVLIAVITFYYRPMDRGVISFRSNSLDSYHRDWLGHISVGKLNQLNANVERFEPAVIDKMATYTVSYHINSGVLMAEVFSIVVVTFGLVLLTRDRF